MKNCYEKALELITLAEEISDLCNLLGKTVRPTERARIEKEIDVAETKLFNIKNNLKRIEYRETN